MKKNIKNQGSKGSLNRGTASLVNYLNRIITTQTQLFETRFNLDSFMNFALSQILALTNATGAAIEICEKEKTVYRYTCGSMKKYENLTTPLDQSISLLSINTHQIVRSNHAITDDRIPADGLRMIGSPLSLITAPLFHEGKSIGALNIVSQQSDEFDDIAVQTARILVGLMGYAISQNLYKTQNLRLLEAQSHTLQDLKKTEKELEHSINHDYLTGLPNRQLFNEQLAIMIKKAKRKKSLVALLYMNIDHFKKINETLGHTIGDKLLSTFVLRLREVTRESDIMARLGGDEFVLLADDIAEAQDVIIITDKILSAMRKPFHVHNKIIHITISIGIAFLNDFNISADEFIKQADQALYIAKNSGRNTFYIFNSELQHEIN